MFADRPARAAADPRRGQALRWTDAATLQASSQVSAGLTPLFDTPFAARVATRWYGRGDRYPLAPLAVAPAGPLPGRPPFAAGDIAIGSPGLALFARWCTDHAQAAANDACPVLGPAPGRRRGYLAWTVDGAAARELSTLSAPQWLAQQEPGMRLLRSHAAPDHPCMEREARGVWGGLYDSLRLRLAAAEEEVPFNPCFAVTTLSARDLGSTGTPGLSGEALARLIEGRLVLLGVDLDSAPDRTESPVNGSAPAVLLHATALENLLNTGLARAREPPEWPSIGNQVGLMLSLLLAAFSAIPATAMVDGRIAAIEADCRQDQPLRGGLLLIAALGLAPLAAAFFGPLALGVGALVAAILLRAAVALAPGMLGGTALLAALAGGLLLPLTLALGIYFLTNWAPANWISGLTAKLFMLGGATSAVIGFLHRRRPVFVARVANWPGWSAVGCLLRSWPSRLVIGTFMVVGIVWIAICLKSGSLSALLPSLPVIALTVALLIFLAVGSWPAALLPLLMAGLALSAARTGWYPDEGLFLVFGWLATLALFPLVMLPSLGEIVRAAGNNSVRKLV
jgi:hypothetical protein